MKAFGGRGTLGLSDLVVVGGVSAAELGDGVAIALGGIGPTGKRVTVSSAELIVNWKRALLAPLRSVSHYSLCAEVLDSLDVRLPDVHAVEPKYANPGEGDRRSDNTIVELVSDVVERAVEERKEVLIFADWSSWSGLRYECCHC